MSSSVTMGSAPATSRVPSAAELEWRILRLSKLGAGDELAAEIAAGDVDVHDLERLLELSCPLELAFGILR